MRQRVHAPNSLLRMWRSARSGNRAQQSHSSHVAQHYLCDIGLAITISRRRNPAVTVIGAACACGKPLSSSIAFLSGGIDLVIGVRPLKRSALYDMGNDYRTRPNSRTFRTRPIAKTHTLALTYGNRGKKSGLRRKNREKTR